VHCGPCRLQTLSHIMIPNFRSNDTQHNFSMVTCCVKRMCLDGKLYLQTLSGCDLPFCKIHDRHFLCITLLNIDYRSVFIKFKTNIPSKGIARPQFNFHIPVSVSDFYDKSAYSAAGNMWTDPANRSQKHECGNWD
jgi:hypothetical protein